MRGVVERLLRRWSFWIARRRLRQLDRLDVDGLEHLRAALAVGPVIAAANHVCWWDAMVALALTERAGVDFCVLMDEQNLREFTFFRRIGAIGVDRHGRFGARAGLRRAQAALSGPGRLLWVFPQGEYRSPAARPLGLEGGVVWLARASGAALVPVSLLYPFLQSPAPAAFVTVGAPVEAQTAALESALIEGLDAGEERAKRQRFQVVARPSIGARALGWIFGGAA